MYREVTRPKAESGSLFDRAIEYFAPRTALARKEARVRLSLARNFEAASVSRRTRGWRAPTTGPNDAARMGLDRLRARSRDLVRNNPWAAKAISVIESNAVGAGIVPQVHHKNPAVVKKLEALWKAWGESTSCDPERRTNFYGMQALAMREIAEGGEILVRGRWRRPEDRLTVPLQLQMIEADHLDPMKDGPTKTGELVQGVEFDKVGRRIAYHLFPRHPGERGTFSLQSVRIDASEILHAFRADRVGQVRGIPWGAPCLLRQRDFDEFEDAVLLRQKVANLFGVIIRKPEGIGDLGAALPSSSETGEVTRAALSLEPAMIKYTDPGEDVTLLDPPDAGGYADYARISLLAIAAGYGVSYEALTGDLKNTSFSSGRMGWLEFARAVTRWQWHVLIAQLCEPVWEWFVEAAVMAGELDGYDVVTEPPRAVWTPPRREMIDPVAETNGIKAAIRAGLMTREEACLTYGRDPSEVLERNAQDFAEARAAGLLLDVDGAADLGRKNGPLAEKPAASAASKGTKEPPRTE